MKIDRPFPVFLVCCALAMALGVLQGQDANWDLCNYHYYDPYALLHHRLDVDLAPAQLQTFFSPVWDLWGYGLIRGGLGSMSVTALLALPAGSALFVLVLVAQRLAPRSGWATPFTLCVGATGAVGLAEMGTSMSEWHGASLLLLGTWLLLGPEAKGERRLRLVGLAGLCGGAAVGLKLTAAPFALGLAAMALGLPGAPRARLARLATLGVGGVLGTALFYGPWAWELYRRYGNPFFPFFNDVFRSPWLPPTDLRDELSVQRGLQILTLPVRLGLVGVSRDGNEFVRDLRYLLAIPALCWGAFRSPPLVRPAWRGLACAWVTGFVLWAPAFGILRYALVLELAGGLAIVLATGCLVSGWARPLALAVLTAVLVLTTGRPDLGRLPHGRPAVEVGVPPLPPDTMVVVLTPQPVAYVVPSLAPGVPVVSLVNNLFSPGQTPEPALYRLAVARIQEHRGPLVMLVRGSLAAGNPRGVSLAEELARLGLAPDEGRCLPFDSYLSPDLKVCALDRRTR